MLIVVHLPAVDDDVGAGVENQEKVGDVGQHVTPGHWFNSIVLKNTLISRKTQFLSLEEKCKNCFNLSLELEN